MLSIINAVLQIVGKYVEVVQIHTSVHFQVLAFDFLLGKIPGGKGMESLHSRYNTRKEQI